MIHTPRLVLRPPEPGDLAALHRVFCDPCAMRYWSRPAHTSLAQTEHMLARMIAGAEALGTEFVVVRAGAVIGKAGMWRMGEIGYILHPEHWRQGLGREALEAVLPYAFARYPDLAEIIAEIDPRNTASARLLGNLGFYQTHRAENTVEIDGAWCDSAYYQLDRPQAVPEKA